MYTLPLSRDNIDCPHLGACMQQAGACTRGPLQRHAQLSLPQGPHSTSLQHCQRQRLLLPCRPAQSDNQNSRVCIMLLLCTPVTRICTQKHMHACCGLKITTQWSRLGKASIIIALLPSPVSRRPPLHTPQDPVARVLQATTPRIQRVTDTPQSSTRELWAQQVRVTTPQAQLSEVHQAPH